MPELPEVESIKLQLQKYLIGHIVENITVSWQKTFPEGKEHIIGAKIIAVRRFGKVLVIDFDNDYSLAVHIKMTGQLIYRGPNLKSIPRLSKKVYGGVPGKHTHVIIKFKIPHFVPSKIGTTRGKQSEKSPPKAEQSRSNRDQPLAEKVKEQEAVLYYNDLRKFGWMKVVKTTDLKSISLLGNMGPEPLNTLTLDMFQNILFKNKQPIKIVLMDQSKISGVGNIYANDALYLAKIHPTRKSNALSEREIKTLFSAIEEVLKRGIKAGGASENAFVTPDGTEGSYQEISLVYGKKGENCRNCGRLIEKIQLGGRGTYFCPKCQV